MSTNPPDANNAFLRYQTPSDWTDYVTTNLDRFLIDHAACEKKASGMAMSMVSHYPDRPNLVSKMIDLALEELNHFKEVAKLVYQRGLTLQADEKDPYIAALHKQMRKGSDVYFLDRLLIAAIVEARGHERFGLMAEALEDKKLKGFYRAITQSEGRHYELFLNLALEYFSKTDVDTRLDELLDIEADIVSKLPIRAALH